MAASTAPAEDVGAAREVLRELFAAGAQAALIVELAAENGRVAPRPFVRAPMGPTTPSVDLAAFMTLAAAPGWHRPDSAPGLWGEDAGAAQGFFVSPLLVEP